MIMKICLVLKNSLEVLDIVDKVASESKDENVNKATDLNIPTNLE